MADGGLIVTSPYSGDRFRVSDLSEYFGYILRSRGVSAQAQDECEGTLLEHYGGNTHLYSYLRTLQAFEPGSNSKELYEKGNQFSSEKQHPEVSQVDEEIHSLSISIVSPLNTQPTRPPSPDTNP